MTCPECEKARTAYNPTGDFKCLGCCARAVIRARTGGKGAQNGVLEVIRRVKSPHSRADILSEVKRIGENTP